MHTRDHVITMCIKYYSINFMMSTHFILVSKRNGVENVILFKLMLASDSFFSSKVDKPGLRKLLKMLAEMHHDPFDLFFGLGVFQERHDRQKREKERYNPQPSFCKNLGEYCEICFVISLPVLFFIFVCFFFRYLM